MGTSFSSPVPLHPSSSPHDSLSIPKRTPHLTEFLTNVGNQQVYAVTTGSLSAVTALIYLIPFIARIPFLFVWDTILFILWIALFGLFGNMYIKEDAEGNAGIKRMKNAVVCIFSGGVFNGGTYY